MGDYIWSGEERERLNTDVFFQVLPTQRAAKDMFQDMRAQARSIQAADDPERLFGERPQRRRYRTGDVRMRPTLEAATIIAGGTPVIIPSSAAVGCDRC